MAGTVVLACSLVPASAGLRPLLRGVVIGLGVVAVAAAVVGRGDVARGRRRGFMVGTALLAVGFVPAASAADVVAVGLGPFATPYQRPATTYLTQVAAQRFQSDVTPFERLVDRLPEHVVAGVFYSSGYAGGFIMLTGHEFLPIGGFTGGAPVPTVARISQLASEGQIHLALLPLDAHADPRVAWIMSHCATLGPPLKNAGGVTLQNYRCPTGPQGAVHHVSGPRPG
ncbi:MAG TPA: hypothetical protein VL961_10995 [Acidimicrobiales bacterium]|nr:hypothetical protein [Acidimicrobiales bacterium]